MSKFEKALERLIKRPKDFTWQELQSIMSHFEYEELKGSGSRRKFINRKTQVLISLHQPHPKPILKNYAVEIVINHLREEGLI
jgi:hypothetical protein